MYATKRKLLLRIKIIVLNTASKKSSYRLKFSQLPFIFPNYDVDGTSFPCMTYLIVFPIFKMEKVPSDNFTSNNICRILMIRYTEVEEKLLRNLRLTWDK